MRGRSQVWDLFVPKYREHASATDCLHWAVPGPIMLWLEALVDAVLCGPDVVQTAAPAAASTHGEGANATGASTHGEGANATAGAGVDDGAAPWSWWR